MASFWHSCVTRSKRQGSSVFSKWQFGSAWVLHSGVRTLFDPRKIGALRVGLRLAHADGMKVQEKAQALVRRGEPAAAVQLLDRYLSEFDGDWGMWLYFAGLNARMAKKDAAIAAYRVCARQLESEGHFARAREALSSAVQLAPHDVVLRHELEEIGRPLRRPRLPDPAIHLTAVIPGRRRRPPPDITDPHCPLFEFLDAERTLS